MHPNESAEDYLESILILSKKSPEVRSVDIARKLGFSKPSVSVAMKNLKEKEMITISAKGLITLTNSGRKVAEMIFERHECLSDWLISLGVSPEVAVFDACRLEHDLSPESFAAIKHFITK